VTARAKRRVTYELTAEEMALLAAYTECENQRTGYRLKISEVARGILLRHIGAANPSAPMGTMPFALVALDKLLKPVTTLLLPTRTGYALREAGVLLIGQIVQKTEKDLRSIRGLGVASLTNIKDALGDRGLSLKMRLDQTTRTAIEKAAKAFSDNLRLS